MNILASDDDFLFKSTVHKAAPGAAVKAAGSPMLTPPALTTA